MTTPQTNPKSYVRTARHVIPQGVPHGTQMVAHGWGIVGTNYRTWKTGSVRMVGSHGYIELSTFQMAQGLVEDPACEGASFHDLVARGYVPPEEAQDVVRQWCDTGEIPVRFTRAGGAQVH